VRELPTDWPANVVRVLPAPGVLACGCDGSAGHWSIFARRHAIAPEVGYGVFPYHDQPGYAVRTGGPANVD
jgi:hypothetical protein